MGMTRGTALVLTTAHAARLTGHRNLASVETDGAPSLADLLVTASDAIYDQLDGDGVDPTKLINQTVYERAVAWHFVATLVIGGYLPLPDGIDPPKNEQGSADPYAWSDPHYKRVQPQLSSGDGPVKAGVVVPRVLNINGNHF